MIEALGDVGALLAVGTAAPVIAFALRDMRGRLEQAERLMWHIREDQARLLEILRDERRFMEEETGRERTLRAQEVRQESEGRERERRVRLDAEAKIASLEGEVRRLQQARRAAQPVPASLVEGRIESGKPPQAEPPASRSPEKTPRQVDPHGTATRPAGEAAAESRRPGHGTWHPHPDDGKDAPRRSNPRSAAPVEMFRKHYEKYLENYRGYVELVEGLHRARDNGDAPSGALGRREWEDRLRRIEDGIKRTTARLDILEQHNPELATDERISQRAEIARRHSRLL